MGEPLRCRLLTVDIDGTLTLVHGWRLIARAFDRLPDLETSDRRLRAGEIDEDQHLTDFLRVVEGRSLAEVEAVLARTPTLTGISEGVAELRSRGIVVALLTHNPAYVVDWYRTKFGFDDGEGSPGQAVVTGRIGPPKGVRADKTAGLDRLTARHGVDRSEVVHVGDSLPDVAVFRLVGGAIAVNAASPEVERSASVAIRTRDFRDIVRALGRLTPRS
jgi:phosphoserine phosphatase